MASITWTSGIAYAPTVELIVNQQNQDIAANLQILYGGSCKPENAKGLFAMADIDGGLIGGAS